MMQAARYPNNTETRSAQDVRANGRQLVGYAAVFNIPADLGGFTETIAPGAFRKSLLKPGLDVLALVDHDTSKLLARTSSNTLRLTEDAKGLSFQIDVPDTSVGSDLLALAQRGDIGGCSFGFRVVQEAWSDATTRKLIEVDLLEISIVQAWPAYPQTSVSARSRTSWMILPKRRLTLLGLSA